MVSKTYFRTYGIAVQTAIMVPPKVISYVLRYFEAIMSGPIVERNSIVIVSTNPNVIIINHPGTHPV